ncbi:Mannose-6-phosphate receptor binding protein [Macrophomina phaseolina MS6]|uniref:Mannose-6-phosphate receptor binding protein n=1 Tax=Macrophomina phaseolina (strain MS6) TaxID=1126212 RepID=K2R4L2_MACPH|nr:Mannose-6-phosphate receptor binding protein [Macrophomina phaseolina MS6]
MKLAHACALAAVLWSALGHASSDDKKEKKAKPCTIKSPSDRFFDLNPISVQPDSTKKGKDGKSHPAESWHAKGYDYPANFTLNFCSPVVEELDSVVGLDSHSAKNVSAFYTQHGKTYSIGQQNSELVFRGRKLILNYTGGSPCGEDSEYYRRDLNTHESLGAKKKGDDDDDDDRDKPKKGKGGKRRKATIISLLCETDALSASDEATVAFVAASPDECTYFFEARSKAACGGIEKERQQLGPGGVFGVIVMIAFLVYFVGGCVYQRTVMHQRGWRQIPNFSFWESIWRFFTDVFTILTSSCARFLPSRRGYSRVSLNGDRNRGRGRDSDDENRLIDELDESWND